ncbi:unnamed protein product [Aphanomyces euteiches]|uniref:Uncharacterized protein n=1 Tax=Aphanomyces euteiches TaxID=100861 RepID=A0A6G0XYN6_9STRA|nr:hypothetical protein Ae201684_000090 [Aphanomyces euteiches]KAH9092023.1 hypothetical protein Ae201684P_011562 [Aphanomyces euteiches]
MHRLRPQLVQKQRHLWSRTRRFLSHEKKDVKENKVSEASVPPPAPPTTTPPLHVDQSAHKVASDIIHASQQLQHMYMNMQGKNWNAWGLGILAIGAVGVVAFGPEMRSKMTKTTAEVATETLQNESLQIQTQELASQIVQTVLNDPKVLDQASVFLKKLFAMEMTHVALVHLTSNVLNDPQTSAHVTKLAKQILFNLFQDPHTLRQFVDLIKSAIVDPQTRASVIQLLDQLMQDEATRARLTKLMAWTFVQEPVKGSVTKTMTSSVHQVMSNRDIQDHAKEFIGGVIRDETVQTQSGEALWKTLMYVFTPSWLSWFWQSSSPPEDGPSDVVVIERPTE